MTLLPTCFGENDLELGQHPLDAERTKTMISEARGSGASDDDIRGAVTAFLLSKGVDPIHLRNQQVRLEKFLSAS